MLFCKCYILFLATIMFGFKSSSHRGKNIHKTRSVLLNEIKICVIFFNWLNS